MCRDLARPGNIVAETEAQKQILVSWKQDNVSKVIQKKVYISLTQVLNLKQFFQYGETGKNFVSTTMFSSLVTP